MLAQIVHMNRVPDPRHRLERFLPGIPASVPREIGHADRGSGTELLRRAEIGNLGKVHGTDTMIRETLATWTEMSSAAAVTHNTASTTGQNQATLVRYRQNPGCGLSYSRSKKEMLTLSGEHSAPWDCQGDGLGESDSTETLPSKPVCDWIIGPEERMSQDKNPGCGNRPYLVVSDSLRGFPQFCHIVEMRPPQPPPDSL